MEIKEIKDLDAKITNLLSQRRIKEALDLLNFSAKKTQNAAFIDDVYSLEQSYIKIVEFQLYGNNDPHKDIPYNALISSVYYLSDQITSVLSEQYYQKYIKDTFGTISQNDSISPIYKKIAYEYNSTDEAFLILREESFCQLFNALSFSSYSPNSVIELATNAFTNNDITEDEKLNLVTSLYLSLMNYFDERKITLLINLVESDNYAIAARASVILIFALIIYDLRIIKSNALLNQITALKKNTLFEKRFKTIFFQLLNAKQTEKISHKFTNEILPEMIKINPIIQKKLDLENLLSDKPNEEIMPDWEDLINESPELGNKIDEIFKMQQEGFDLLSSTFKNLKTFPFFNTLSNWFAPFHGKQSFITTLLKTENKVEFNKLINFIRIMPNVCNSDKYSMLFAMSTMPLLYKDMLKKLPHNELSEDQNALFTNPFSDSEQQFKNHSNLYIQDLYRFHTAFPNRIEFSNPFELEFDFHLCRMAFSIVPEQTMLKELANYHFKNQNYQKASEIYLLYLEKAELQVEILQKIGFAFQQLKEFEKALIYYLQADFFDKNKEWNNKKIALCYRNLNQPQKALEYYLLAEIQDPENLHTQAAIGQCHIELHNYEEALKNYFKVEFLDQSNTKIWKPIAWCCYVLGKFDVSEKYYDKLCHLDNVTDLDIMSYGNLLFVMGKKREAISQYKRCLTSPNLTLNQFIDIFKQETTYLKSHQIDEIDIATLLDEIRYILGK